MSEAEPAEVFFAARVRGMRSHLFSRATLEELLTQNDLQRLIDTLLESPYRTEMAEALTRFHGADAVEEALLRNLVATFTNLIARAQGDFKTLVEIFLSRWDLDAAKSLLRMKHQDVPAEEAVQFLIPGPGISVPLLQELAKYENVEALAGGLVAWNSSLCRCLIDALPRYRETGDVGVLEEALDRRYFVSNARKLRVLDDPNAQQLREELRAEIDRINLRTVFQLVQSSEKGNVGERLLPEGTLSVSLLESMAAAPSIESAMEQLSATRYQPLLEELFQYLQTQRFSPIERFFEKVLMDRLRHLAHTDVFGLAVMMHFVWLKRNEIVNLRLIARGLSGHLPAGRVRDELNFAA